MSYIPENLRFFWNQTLILFVTESLDFNWKKKNNSTNQKRFTLSNFAARNLEQDNLVIADSVSSAEK